MNQSHTREVARHYDQNTRRFLARGQHAGIRNIHQPLWPAGVRTLAEASSVSNEMMLDQCRKLVQQFDHPIRVLDLGCGVGSTALYLGNMLQEKVRVCGITISGEQVKMAQGFAQQEDLAHICSFEQGDFLNLKSQAVTHLMYAIEAFLHGPDPEGFFREAASRLIPGGKLVLIDDFLTNDFDIQTSPRTDRWLNDFREGWLAGSLISDAKAEEMAISAGLKPVHNQNLTPWMKLGRPRDQLIGLARLFLRKQMQASTYWRALSGGYAKQQCLKHGIVAYRMLAFER